MEYNRKNGGIGSEDTTKEQLLCKYKKHRDKLENKTYRIY